MPKIVDFCSFDGNSHATLADGSIIQIDVRDAHLLGFGPWRCYGHKGPSVILKKVSYSLVKMIFGPVAEGNAIIYRNGDKFDLRRSNLCSSASPFSAERLNELYWFERKTLDDIADLAQPLMDYRPTDMIVLKWLKTAGIRRRTRGEILKMQWRDSAFVAANKAGMGRMWEKRYAGELPMPSPDGPPKWVTKKARKAWAKKRAVRKAELSQNESVAEDVSDASNTPEWLQNAIADARATVAERTSAHTGGDSGVQL